MSAPCIFVVDDEPAIANTLGAILKLNGYCVTSFTSPLEALAAAQLRAPDLLISDVLMPGLSGVDLAIQIRLNVPDCKILLFSGQTATRDLLDSARSRGHNFELLEKPVPPVEILARVEALTAGLAGDQENVSQSSGAECKIKPFKTRSASNTLNGE